MIPFDLQNFRAKLAANRDPRAPSPEPQDHVIWLEAPTTPDEHWERWDEACAWCWRHVDQNDQREVWSRHRERDGSLIFTFSDPVMAVHFALRFMGV